jgi:D-psicose/D-tagatose/L-ribulose 3-epimerase
MNLAMSNIAWSPSKEEEVAGVLREAGLSAIEIAPTTVWPRPLDADPREVEDYRRLWERRGFPIVALQALLFGQDDLRLFEDGAEGRGRLLRYLEGIMDLGARLGARALVFGSPKARRREGLPMDEALRIAADFFRDVGESAERRGVCICIEANPPQYGADFIVNAGEAIGLVSGVDRSGFRLHLDTACMRLAGDDLESSITAGAPFLRHFHVSEPDLAPVGAPGSGIDHVGAAAALRGAGYKGYVSVEMRSGAPEHQLETVGRAAAFARETYG